jgi:hypothetical protein
MEGITSTHREMEGSGTEIGGMIDEPGAALGGALDHAFQRTSAR